MKINKPLVQALALTLTCSTHAIAANSITEALEASKPFLDLRARYERNDTDNALDTADAITLKTTVGIRTGEFSGFSVLLDMVNVRSLDEDYLDATTDTIADPEGDELTQGYIQYATDGTVARWGRQRIIYDNARFVGNVGWRQNEQTYDGFSLKNTSIEDLTINLAYLVAEHGILFNSKDHETILANASYKNAGPGTLGAYVYLIEFPDVSELTTYGVSYKGKIDTFSYHFEYATQESEPTGGTDRDADYLFVEGGAKLGPVTAKVGYELLGSDEGAYGFQTPLATKHKFNGWADKFLATPADGLEDIYVSASGKVGGVKLAAIYHTFSGDESGDDLGDELDLLAVKKFSKHYSAGLKHAMFSGEGGQVDTDKTWIWVQATF